MKTNSPEHIEHVIERLRDCAEEDAEQFDIGHAKYMMLRAAAQLEHQGRIIAELEEALKRTERSK